MNHNMKWNFNSCVSVGLLNEASRLPQWGQVRSVQETLTLPEWRYERLSNYLTIGRGGETLRSSFALHPDNLVGRVTMTSLDRGHVAWLGAFAGVPEHDLAIVLSTDEDVRVFWVVFDTDKGWGWFQRCLGSVWVFWRTVEETQWLICQQGCRQKTMAGGLDFGVFHRFFCVFLCICGFSKLEQIHFGGFKSGNPLKYTHACQCLSTVFVWLLVLQA